MYGFQLRIGIRDLDPGQMRQETVAIELLLQNQTVDVEHFIRLAVQLDERIEDRITQHASVSRIRLRNAPNVIRDLDQLIFMQGAEEQHVPIRRQLPDVVAKLLL